MLAEVLQTIPRGGRCLIIGVDKPGLATQVAEAVGAEEAVLVETSYEILGRETSVTSPIKTTPVFTRVIERVVELPSNSFDLVISIHSLERALNRKAFMTEMRRLLKEGGKLVIFTRLRNFFNRRGLKKKDFETILSLPGFKIEHRKTGWGEAVVVLTKQV